MTTFQGDAFQNDAFLAADDSEDHPVLVTVGVATAVSVTRSSGKAIEVVIGLATGVGRAVAKTVTTDCDAAAHVVRAITRSLVAITEVTGTVTRNIGLHFTTSVVASVSVAFAFIWSAVVSAGTAAGVGMFRAIGKNVTPAVPLAGNVVKGVSRAFAVGLDLSASTVANQGLRVFLDTGVRATAAFTQIARRLLFRAGLALGLTDGATGAHPERGQITGAATFLRQGDAATTAHPARGEVTRGGLSIGRKDTLFD